MKQMHINYFCRVARSKSITMVARELGVSQPAVSYAIKEFEEELGLKLFSREKKRLNLTPDGKKIYSFLGPALEKMDAAVRKSVNYSKSKSILRVAVPQVFGAMSLSGAINSFREHFPDYKVLAKEMEFQEARNAVLSGDADIAIQVYPKDFNDEDLVQLNANEPPLYCVVNRSHPLAKADSLRFDEIGNTPILLPNENSIIYQSVISEYERQGIIPNIVLSSPQQSTIVEMLGYGDAAAFLCKDSILESNPKLKFIPVKPEIKFVSGCFYARSNELSQTAKDVIAYVMKVMSAYRFK
ncbi:MAG: LysR family transcriptional regulator [Bacilli bacterium]|nr:LysR family transcriptional regulator [Bacilli bacterium]